jgi:hypothetical protein
MKLIPEIISGRVLLFVIIYDNKEYPPQFGETPLRSGLRWCFSDNHVGRWIDRAMAPLCM